MAIYSLNISNIKRSDGKSSVAKAAYNSRSKLEDIRTGKTYDYSLKKDLGFSEIIAPTNAPDWMKDRQKLWAANEMVNKRRDSRVAKEIMVALPREMSRNQQINLLKKFIETELKPLGVVADLNAHELDREAVPPANWEDWNPHAHILITTNHIDGDSFGKKITELNKKDFVVNLRKSWADLTNEALELANSKEKVDHRSLEAQGINRIPQIHLGAKVTAMTKKGIQTERRDKLEDIKKYNSKINQDKEKRQTQDKKKPNTRRMSGIDVVKNSMSEFRKKQVNHVSSPKINHLDISQPEEQKTALAQAMIEQLDNHLEINRHLRTKAGKLVLLVNKNKISVFSLMFSSSREQQEKLILEKKEKGWQIIKYKLSNYQRSTLLQVIEKVKQESVKVKTQSLIENLLTQTKNQYSDKEKTPRKSNFQI